MKRHVSFIERRRNNGEFTTEPSAADRSPSFVSQLSQLSQPGGTESHASEGGKTTSYTKTKQYFELLKQSPSLLDTRNSASAPATVATIATNTLPGGGRSLGPSPSKQSLRAVSFLNGRKWQKENPVVGEAAIVAWLNANPVPSSFDNCAHCGDADRPYDPLGPHGAESSVHAWVHRSCWAAWMSSRRAQALAALGVHVPEPVRTPIPIATIIFDRMVSLFQEAPIPLARRFDEAVMADCYREYTERNAVPLHQDFIDWGLVPQDFEQEWANVRALWFTEVHDAAIPHKR